MEVTVVDGDLFAQDVDVLVHAWHRNLLPRWLCWLSFWASRELWRHAGSAPFRELARHGPMALGSAVSTSAGRLPHRAIVHVAVVGLLGFATESSIRAAVRNAIAVARRGGARSVAMPLVGAVFGARRPDKVRQWITAELGRAPFAGEVRLVASHPRPKTVLAQIADAVAVPLLAAPFALEYCVGSGASADRRWLPYAGLLLAGVCAAVAARMERSPRTRRLVWLGLLCGLSLAVIPARA